MTYHDEYEKAVAEYSENQSAMPLAPDETPVTESTM